VAGCHHRSVGYADVDLDGDRGGVTEPGDEGVQYGGLADVRKGLMWVYDYIFYKLFRFADGTPSKLWPTEFKALATLCVIEAWLLVATAIVLSLDHGVVTGPNTISIVIAVSVVFGSNYLLFEWKDRWKNIVKRFEQWPRKKQVIGGYFVWSIMLGAAAWVVVCFTVLLP